jgi:hypothetical protein
VSIVRGLGWNLGNVWINGMKVLRSVKNVPRFPEVTL